MKLIFLLKTEQDKQHPHCLLKEQGSFSEFLTLFSYSVGLNREMLVSILQASIKLLNAPFHLVLLLLTVTF